MTTLYRRLPCPACGDLLPDLDCVTCAGLGYVYEPVPPGIDQLYRRVACTYCDGRGHGPYVDGVAQGCTPCHGTGITYVLAPDALPDTIRKAVDGVMRRADHYRDRAERLDTAVREWLPKLARIDAALNGGYMSLAESRQLIADLIAALRAALAGEPAARSPLEADQPWYPITCGNAVIGYAYLPADARTLSDHWKEKG